MLCCVCLLENLINVSIFDEVGQHLKIAELIQKYLWFKPQPDGKSTTKICTICWHKIEDFHNFYQTVKKAHEEYEKKSIILLKLETQCLSPIKLEEHDCDDFINNSDIALIEPKCELQMKNPLEENCFETILNEDSDDEDCQSFDDYEPSNLSKTFLIEEELEYDNGEIIQNNISSKRKNTQKHKKKVEKVKDDAKKKIVSEHLEPIYSEELIKKHIPMSCNLCAFVGTCFSDIVQHFKKGHPQVRPYIMCCDKKLTKRFLVAQHAMKHEDPNCFRCKECNKSFATLKILRAHNLKYHAREEDLIFACNSCPKKFALGNLLEFHKTSHIPKEQWQYFCNKCPDKKRFASSFLLKKHNSIVHNKGINICPVCAKEIKNVTFYEKHVRLHYEGSGPSIKCPYSDCNSWLKDKYNLKEHLARHNPEGKIHKCDECGRICKNRRALTYHKRCTHTDKKKIFQCEQCDKKFKKAISLRKHLNQLTCEILYKCCFCTITFDSRAKLRTHKKKQHPLEFEEMPRNKLGSSQKLLNSNNTNQIDESIRHVLTFE